MADIRKSVGRIRRSAPCGYAKRKLSTPAGACRSSSKSQSVSRAWSDFRHAIRRSTGRLCMPIGSIAIYSAERSGFAFESDIFLAHRNDGTRIRRGRRPRAFRYRWALSRELPQAGTLRQPQGSARSTGFSNGTDRRRPVWRVYQPARRRHRRHPAPVQRHILDASRIEAQKGQTSDVLGNIDYFVVGTPVSVDLRLHRQTAGSLPRRAHHGIGRRRIRSSWVRPSA